MLAPRLQKLGTHTFKVTTKSARAQLFVNQGLNLAYGFNHAEAGRAFAEAARLDPACAMAYWGQALVLGPNINAAMAPDDEPKALALVQKAQSLARGVTRARACLHRRARDTLHREGRRTAGRRSRVCRCDARAHEEIPARPRCGDDFCRVADGPAAVELLDAGRGTTGGDRGGRGHPRARDRIESETSRRASLLDSPVGADQKS